MCGICGALGPAAAAAIIDQMLDQMTPRGPDGFGTWKGDGLILGHRRLAIVDLSERGRQPMALGNGAVVATVNGEIYNYPELRRELESGGAVFASDCDSEVVLHAYRAWGADSFSRFNGMFAFGLWDAALRKLYVVRDRLGIKPVYYLEQDGLLTFASDVRALVAATGKTSWNIDPCGLGQYLAFQNVFGEETLFSGVKSVRPGHFLEHDGSTLAQRPYWRAEFRSGGAANLKEAAGVTASVLSGAVKRHLMSDVLPAAYLSAGMDSTIVATIAASNLSEPLRTFTGSFTEGGWYDETTGAGLVAHKIGAQHTAVEIGPEQFRDVFDDMVFALDEPRMGLGAFAQYVVAAKAAESRKMILTGHGGDELFSGYPVFKFALLTRLIRQSPRKALRLLKSLRAGELPHLVYFGLRALRPDVSGSLLPILFSKKLRNAALTSETSAAVESAVVFDELIRLGQESQTPYQKVMRTYLQAYLPGLLTVEDKISMAHSLESRTPLLDNELVELSLGLDEEIKLSGGDLKAVLRSIGRGILPAELFKMPKRGFPTPLGRWLRGDLALWMEERIVGESTCLTRLFRRDYLERAVRRYKTSWRRWLRPLDEIQTQRMWMLLCLESWMRQYEQRLGIRLDLSPGP